MKKIRVCCFLECWESGGIESFLLSLFENIDLEKFEIDVVAEKTKDSVFTDRLRSLGIGLYELSGRLRSPKNRRLFRELLRERRYDVLHLNVFHSLAMAYAKDAARQGVKIRIAHAHGAGLRRSFARPLKLLLHRFGRHVYGKYVTKRIACSTVAAEFLFGNAQGGIVKNGIALDRFVYDGDARREIRHELDVGESALIGAVGRLSWEKNQELLIRALPGVLEHFPDARLLLVGEGFDGPMLFTLAEQLGVCDSVIFYGTSDNVPALLSAMDIFVLPSRFEGLGIAAIEAQCSGLVTLVSEATPSETRVTELAESFPFSEKALSEKIVSHLSALPERRSYRDELLAAGYSDKEKAAALTEYYTEGLDI